MQLLGLDGSFRFLEHVVWLICLILAIIVGFGESKSKTNISLLNLYYTDLHVLLNFFSCMTDVTIIVHFAVYVPYQLGHIAAAIFPIWDWVS
jgi:hypothetical protein